MAKALPCTVVPVLGLQSSVHSHIVNNAWKGVCTLPVLRESLGLILIVPVTHFPPRIYYTVTLSLPFPRYPSVPAPEAVPSYTVGAKEGAPVEGGKCIQHEDDRGSVAGGVRAPADEEEGHKGCLLVR